MNIVFLTPYPLKHSPSQRFRFEQYSEALRVKGVQTICHPFFSERFWNILYSTDKFFYTSLGVLIGFAKRFLLLFVIWRYDFVFLHREASPIGPPIFEWIIAKVYKKKIVYDFDDSIWNTDLDHSQKLKIWLRNPSKTRKIIQWSWKISCGNEYLCNYARQYNKNVVLNPTTIDTVNLHSKIKQQQTNRVVIGWTGSHSTLKYINVLLPVLRRLEKEFEFDFLVICNKKPDLKLRSLKFLHWSEKSEIDDLLKINIGVMPLPDDEWSKGKCGFKALQYMALGMPALVSPVGVNSEIVNDGENGFICYENSDWEKYIRMLLLDSELRTSLGLKARQTVVDRYSVVSNVTNFVALFECKSDE